MYENGKWQYVLRDACISLHTQHKHACIQTGQMDEMAARRRKKKDKQRKWWT